MSLYVGDEAFIVSRPLYAARLLACTNRRNDNVLVTKSPSPEAIRHYTSPDILILQDPVPHQTGKNHRKWNSKPDILHHDDSTSEKKIRVIRMSTNTVTRSRKSSLAADY